MNKFPRRDFLKVTGAMLAGMFAPETLFSLRSKGNNSQPNIIIILCDAFSARHLSLYGYSRQTTPYIDAFAELSTVYHQHVSGGNFTTTGTASILTGMFGWKHRAINQGGLIAPEFTSMNPYSLLGADYFKFAFSQNPWSERLVGQNYQDVDNFLPVTAYSLRDEDWITSAFRNDRALASIAVDDFMFPVQGDMAGSSIVGSYHKRYVLDSFVSEVGNSPRYPSGIPEILLGGFVAPYLNEDLYNGVYLELSQLEDRHSPYFAFFHLFSPHFPYRPRREYSQLFHDDYLPPIKPEHSLSPKLSDVFLRSQRTAYDRQIAQVDEEFGRLVDRLGRIGALKNSYLIFTSDHGELFERGFVGHGFHFMYESVLHIPLLIHAPGQITRNDVYSPTSSTDILPTLLRISGREMPSDIDGILLPAQGGQENSVRPIFSVYAADNPAFGPLKKTVIAMRKGPYKLIAYLGYENFDQVFELYNLTLDPEELLDLSGKELNLFSKLKQEFFFYLENANKPFVKK
jgi:arylsulfatase A-like enzyme